MIEKDDAALALRWLLRHPVEYHTILTMARLEEPDQYDYAEFGEGERATAERFIRAGRVAHCHQCYYPVLVLPDGRKRDWPSLDHHNHTLPRPRLVALLPERAEPRTI